MWGPDHLSTANIILFLTHVGSYRGGAGEPERGKYSLDSIPEGSCQFLSPMHTCWEWLPHLFCCQKIPEICPGRSGELRVVGKK